MRDRLKHFWTGVAGEPARRFARVDNRERRAGSPATRRRSGGFTLLELILAMLMIALLSLTLYTCVNIAYKAKRTAERAVNSSRQGILAMEIVGRDLQGAVPPPDPAVSASCSGDFEATHNSLSGGDGDTADFFSVGYDSAADAGPFAEGIRHVILTVRTDLPSPTLVRQIVRNVLTTNPPTPDEEALCSNVRSFSLKYWDGSTWQDQWDSESVNNFIPQQVQVDLVVAADANKLKNRDTSGDYHFTRVFTLPMSRSS